MRVKALEHLRLYESGQVLVPGAVGVLSQPGLPALHLLLLYSVAYASHVLSVYSFNDLCDYDTDSLNPRKSVAGPRRLPRLRNQTLVLTAVFLASVLFLPSRVRILLLGSQVVCMAYSHPTIRLKRRLLGSELAHFTAGFSYFAAGVLVAGGDLRRHWPGGVVFGLLYLSGGTFNEIMDWDADRKASLRHLVVRAGRTRALGLVVAIHYGALALLAAYQPSVAMWAACAAAAAVYTGLVAGLPRALDDPGLLLRFRRRYRLLFAILIVTLALSRAIAMTGPAGGSPAADPDVTSAG